eukprot:PhM_4_TR18847/c2_g2_i4/m.100389
MLKIESFSNGLFPVARFPIGWSRPGTSVPETSKLIAAFVLAVVGVGKSLKAFHESEYAAQNRLDNLVSLGPHAERAIAYAFLLPNRWSTAEGILDLLMMEFQREEDEHFRHALIASVVPVAVFASREFENFTKGDLRDCGPNRIRVRWLDKPVVDAPNAPPTTTSLCLTEDTVPVRSSPKRTRAQSAGGRAIGGAGGVKPARQKPKKPPALPKAKKAAPPPPKKSAPPHPKADKSKVLPPTASSSASGPAAAASSTSVSASGPSAAASSTSVSASGPSAAASSTSASTSGPP